MSEIYSVHTATIRGIEALPVRVEVSLLSGIPAMTIVGMPDTAILEARWRIQCAIKAAGFKFPRMHITINLSPGELKKSGTGFDLPMVVAILAASGQIPKQNLNTYLFIGEIGLDASISCVRGMVAYALLAHKRSLTLVSPARSRLLFDARYQQKTIRSIDDLRLDLSKLPSVEEQKISANLHPSQKLSYDYQDVADQEIAKHAFVIAATGNHGLLMIGPPGAGKTMLARRMPSILTPLTKEEKIQNLLIQSLAENNLPDVNYYMRPFRSPHHSISLAGMVGGGRPVVPGEISLAHRGVLFLDELPEFAPKVLQSLRQPMEDKEIHIVRVDGTYKFPCDFQLIAAANPCPCGYLGDPSHPCECSQTQITRYRGRIGGPLMDRIDLLVMVNRPKEDKLIKGYQGLSSHEMKEMVQEGLAFCAWRKNKFKEAQSTSISPAQIAGLDSQALHTLESIASRKAFGGRAIAKICKVSRTIADLNKHAQVTREDLLEACSFRN